jgi:hypothetical protein
MMYKLKHWLFGWDYIAWSNTAHQGIARIQKDHNGRVWYWRYRKTEVADVITNADQVLWLTCKPQKYLQQQDEVEKARRNENEACAVLLECANYLTPARIVRHHLDQPKPDKES